MKCMCGIAFVGYRVADWRYNCPKHGKGPLPDLRYARLVGWA